MRLLRTREYRVDKGVPFAIRRDQDFEGFAVDHDDRRPGRFGSIQRVVDLPEHCIDLTDDQWETWERRIHERTPRDTRTDGPRAPFADVRQQWFTTEAGERREAGDPDWTHNYRVVANGESYEVFRRTRAEAHNDRDELRGWNSREGEHLFSVRRRDLDTGYARAGIAQAAAHIGAFEPIVIDPRPLPDPAEQERRRTERLAELEHLIVDAIDAVDDAEVVQERATERGRRVEQATADLIAARTDFQALIEEQEALLLSPAPTEAPVPASTVSVDISEPAVLFGVLDGAAGHRMPRAVSDLLHRLSRARLDVRPDPLLPRMLRVTDVLDWRAEDGTVVPLRISFPVENRKRDLDEAAREAARRETAAALVLRDGHTVDAVAEQLGWTRAETVTRVRAWLKDHGPVNVPSRGGRSAIVDCPLREPKHAVWNAVTGDTGDGGEQFEQLVAPRYLAPVSHANSWIGRDVTLERQVLAVFIALRGQGVDLTGGLPAGDIAARAGCTVQQVMYLCDGPNRSTAASSSGSRARASGSVRADATPGTGCSTCCPHLRPSSGPVCCAPPAGPLLTASSCRPGTSSCGTALPARTTTWPTHRAPPSPRHRLGHPGARPRPLLTIGEAAAYLQVSTSALRDWSNDGLVPCEERPRRYDQRVLDRPDARALAERCPATYGRRTADDSRLTLPQVTERLGVPEHYVRAFLIDTGKRSRSRRYAGQHAAVRGGRHRRCPRRVARAARRRPVGIGPAAQRLGVTVPQMRAAATAGRLPSLITDGGTRRFRRRDVERLRHEARHGGDESTAAAA